MRNRDVKIALIEGYRRLKYRIRGEAKPIHAIGYIPGRTERSNSDLSSISDQEDYNLKCTYTCNSQQKNTLKVSSDHSSETDRKHSVTFEILEYKAEPSSKT